MDYIGEHLDSLTSLQVSQDCVDFLPALELLVKRRRERGCKLDMLVLPRRDTFPGFISVEDFADRVKVDVNHLLREAEMY